MKNWDLKKEKTNIIKKHKKQLIQTGGTIVLLAALCVGSAREKTALGQAYYVVCVDGKAVGAVARTQDVESIIRNGKRAVARTADGYVLTQAEVEVREESKWFTKLQKADVVEEAVVKALKADLMGEKRQAYTVALRDYSSNFETEEEVSLFLNRIKNHTEGGKDFNITYSPKEFFTEDAHSVEMVSGKEEMEQDYSVLENVNATISGASRYFATVANAELLHPSRQQEEIEDGIISMQFDGEIVVYENYVEADSLVEAKAEASEVTKEKETNKLYTVEAGDCLSTIAKACDTTVDSIVSLNALSSQEAPVYTDQQLIVATPEAEISILVTKHETYQENFTAESQVIENGSWYNTEKVVRQEGSAGTREIQAAVTYENGTEVSRNILSEEVLVDAVPQIVEQGTLVPPTYIKPIAGGRFTSGFGRRWGRVHKGVDWSTPVGTAVTASCGGTVAIAGTLNGYGYVVYINHSDGSQTRYGHLSKLLVSAGQTVEQGERIALSGNTGRSTGPHLHFEILMDGSQVNPLNYLN